MPEAEKPDSPREPKPKTGPLHWDPDKPGPLLEKKQPPSSAPKRLPQKASSFFTPEQLHAATPWLGLAAVVLLTGPFLALAIQSHKDAERNRTQLNQSSEELQFLQQENTRLKAVMERLKKENENRHSRLKATEETLSKAEEIELAREQSELAEAQRRKRRDQLKDQVAGDLAATLPPEKLSVFMEEETLVLRLNGKNLFENATHLTREGKDTLKTLADLFNTQLKDHPVLVEAHSDRVPIGDYLKPRYPSNTSLSAARAAAIVDFLAADGAVPATRLAAGGRGEAFPLDWGNGPEADDKNRRIEFRINTQAANPQVEAPRPPVAEPVTEPLTESEPKTEEPKTP